MSKANVLDHNWIDLVFEGRNQNYGAYQLRRDDSKNTMKAFFTTMGLLGAAVAIPMAVSYLNIFPATGEVIATDVPGIEITPVDLEPTVFTQPMQDPVTLQKPATPAAAAPQQHTVQYTNLVAASGAVENPPTTQQVQTTAVGQTTTTGPENTAPVIAPPSTGPVGGTGGGEGHSAEVYNVVDVMPAFPGGMTEFYSQVSRRFRTPETDAATTYKVYVSFVVERDGTMTGIKVLRDPGQGMGAEAIRVLQSFKTRWTPGQKGGRPVRTAYNLPITINVQ